MLCLCLAKLTSYVVRSALQFTRLSIFLLVRSLLDPTSHSIFVCGPLQLLWSLKISFFSARESLTRAGNRNSTQEKVASCTFSEGREICHQGTEALMFCGKPSILIFQAVPFIFKLTCQGYLVLKNKSN